MSEWMNELRINKQIHSSLRLFGNWNLHLNDNLAEVLMDCLGWIPRVVSLLPISPPCRLHLWTTKIPPKERTPVLSHLLVFPTPTEGSHLTQSKRDVSYCPGMRKCSGHHPAWGTSGMHTTCPAVGGARLPAGLPLVWEEAVGLPSLRRMD